jgi:hypothetical protein
VSADNPGFISIVTVCEIGWMLAECYASRSSPDRGSRESAARNPANRGRVGRFGLESATRVAWIRGRLERRAHRPIAAANGARTTVTFDKAAARLPAFELLA